MRIQISAFCIYMLLFTGCESQQSATESQVAVDDTSVGSPDVTSPGPGASADILGSDDTSGLDGPPADTEAPVWPEDASLEASEISAESVRLIWPFASDDTAVTSYRVSLNDVQIAVVSASESTLTVPNPALGVPLSFTVVATDAAGNHSEPLERTTTITDTAPPTWDSAASLLATEIGDTDALLSWSAARDEIGVTEYRILADETVLMTTDGATQATVTGLIPLSEYTLHVVAVDAAGNASVPGPTVSFQTTDTVAPSWTEGSALSFEIVDAESLKVSWAQEATDAGGLSAFQVYQDKVLVGTIDYTDEDTVTELTVSGLSAATTYSFAVQALDLAGNLSSDGPTGIVQMTDKTAPVWPLGATLIASNITAHALTLAWPAASDDVGTTSYLVHQDGQEVAVVSTAHADIEGLSPWTDYTFTVLAVDGAGNQSVPGPSLTLKTPDSSAPVWPAGASLTASAITPHSLTLSWPQATDDVSVVHHHVFQDGVKIATLDAQTTTFSISGLSPWTDYEFNVKGEDQAGNLSDIGLLLTVKTADDSSPTWFPGQLTITAVTPTSLTLLWPNATDDAAVGSWAVTINGSELTTVQANMTSLDVVDLAPWTDYVFTVSALDEAGNASIPLEQAVKTPDNVPPSWSQDAVITASNIASTNLTLLWPEANDDVGVTSYIVSVDGGVVSTVDGQTTTAAISNLIPGATVLFQVRAVDAAGNKGTSLGLTLTMPDGGPPTWEEATLTAVPSGLDAALTWQAATDDIGVVAYRVFVDGQNVLEVAETQAVVSGLMPETTYTFKVEAGDAAGNWSADGPSATATTMKVHDPGFKRLTKYQFNRTLADLTGYIWNVGCSHDYVDHWSCGEVFFKDADQWFDSFNKTGTSSWGKYNHGYPDDQHVHSPDAYHGGFKRLDTKLYQTHISSWVTGAMNLAGNKMEGWVGAQRILRPCKEANDAGLTNYVSDDELYEACMSNFIHDFGKRAYRRPVTSDEHSYLMETYAEAMVDYAQTGEDGFDLYARGLRNVVATILLSPQFIYRIELGDAEGKLTGWELASRLSYHFWDTMPDDELFAAVEDGSLLTPEGYATQVERLFSDPKAQRSIDAFYRDYFRVQELQDPHLQDYPGSRDFPGAGWGWVFYHEGGTEEQEGRVPTYHNDNLSNGIVWGMEQELVNLGRWFTFSQPGTFEEMFRSNLHFMQCPDEPHWDGVMRCSGAGPWSQYTYEIEGTCTDFDDCLEKEWIDTGNGWDGISPPITLPEPERAGLLTRMPLLVHDTHVARPIRRGLAIREMLLCDPVPPPENCDVVKPPNVTGMCESVAGQTGVPCNDDMQCEPGETCVGWDKEVTMTVREKSEALTEVPGTTCANCHSTFINGFGHALGHFSSLGKYWEKEHMYTNDKHYGVPDEFYFKNIEPPENWPEIDTTGTTILDGQWVSFDGPHEVADLLVDSGKMEWCWSREYFRYAIGRFETEADADSIEQMAESLRTGASLADAYKSIAHTLQFKTLVAKPKASSLGGTP